MKLLQKALQSLWPGLALGLLALTACQRTTPVSGAAENALVRVGQRVLTVAQVQAEVDRLPLESRTRYTTPEEQQRFVQGVVQQEILASEAQRLGYQNAPEVVAAQKRALALKLLKERVGSGPQPGDVTETAMREYYQQHLAEFGPPDKARVSIILVKDAAKAHEVLAEAQRAVVEAASRNIDQQFEAFADLVKKYTEEPGARDVTLSLNLGASGYPKAVVDAASALKQVAAVSSLIATDDGYYLLQLKERIPGFAKPFDEVKGHVSRSVSEQVRDRKIAALVAELSKKQEVQVFKERFASVHFDDRQASRSTTAVPPQGPAAVAAIQ